MNEFNIQLRILLVDFSAQFGNDFIDTTVASADTAVTRFRIQYRVVAAPSTPSGSVTYRVYQSVNTATDFVIPQILFLVDKRP